jgi:uncharacterized protein (DUF486 family)
LPWSDRSPHTRRGESACVSFLVDMKIALLLTLSNVFMTFAWYFHRDNKYLKAAPLLITILVSWGIAFFEYCFQVPANRLGHERGFTIAQLKIM